MVKAYAAAVHDDQTWLKRWLLLTVLGGMTFVGVQAYEYTHLIEKGFLPSSSLFGSTFYTMTGFHGFHVTCGVISMMYVTLRAFQGKYAGGKFQGIETIGLYWHFVDLVWIILFTIVYLF
jgi:cytochrome c oxidase subunit 3/cytochrome o ubiquinol oxidase subunit 3